MYTKLNNSQSPSACTFLTSRCRGWCKFLLLLFVLWLMVITVKNATESDQLRRENTFMRGKIKEAMFGQLKGEEEAENYAKVDEFEYEGEEVEVPEYEEPIEPTKDLNDGITEEARRYIQLLNLTSPGANGQPVILPENLPEEVKKKVEEGYEVHGFNAFVSSLISLNRDIPDVRSDYCKEKVYDEDLPTCSVIIPFHDDDWSLLMRTVHSVLRYSPPRLIEEIILVDDFSTRDYLKEQLDNYTRTLHKVKVIRSHQRLGGIANRVLGARNAIAPVIVFIDSHVEVSPGWLEPLLARLKDHENLLVWSKISTLRSDTLAVTADSSSGGIGGFTWDMGFQWLDPKLYNNNFSASEYEPRPSPTFMGPTYALWRHWFEKVGYYDTDMDIWGGEDVELAFRMWMCHGRVEHVPCSFINHVFREHKYSMQSPGKGGYRWNTDRIAETWLGEYRKYYYRSVGDTKNRNFGDISSRLAIKEKLQCHDFKWYLENVHPKQEIPENLQDPPTTAAAAAEKSIEENEGGDFGDSAFESELKNATQKTIKEQEEKKNVKSDNSQDGEYLKIDRKKMRENIVESSIEESLSEENQSLKANRSQSQDSDSRTQVKSSNLTSVV